MGGIKELSEILRNLNPILSEGDYMFCSFQNLTAGDLKDLEPFGMIRETGCDISARYANCSSQKYKKYSRII